jgi:hypothetical protein
MRRLAILMLLLATSTPARAVDCLTPLRVVDPSTGRVTLSVVGPISPELNLTLRWSSGDQDRISATLSAAKGIGWSAPACPPDLVLVTTRRIPFENGGTRGASYAGIITVDPRTLLEPGAFSLNVCRRNYGLNFAMRCGIGALGVAAAKETVEWEEAQAARRPADIAGPSSASLPLNADEPFGIALKGGVPEVRLSWQVGGRIAPGKLRVLWGARLSTVEQLMGPPPKNGSSPVERPVLCYPHERSVQGCTGNPEAPWYVDFGDAPTGRVTPYLQFAPDGTFYAYAATFPVDGFAAIRTILVKRLGAPTADVPGTVQNRMGATFEQETITWLLPHVRIQLMQRGTDINTGFLSGTYLPIEATLPPPSEGKAPM